MNDVRTFSSEKTFLEAVMTSIRSRILKKNAEGRIFRLALSGGSTPLPLYERMAASELIDWSLVEIYLVDERYVPLSDEHSNTAMIQQALVDHISPAKFVTFDTNLSIEESLESYEKQLNTESSKFFDLILLGMGADGHTASLFAEDLLLDESHRWVGHSSKGNPVSDRLTLTYPALKASHEVFFLIKGSAKEETLNRCRDGEKLPAAEIMKLPQTEVFFVDA